MNRLREIYTLISQKIQTTWQRFSAWSSQAGNPATDEQPPYANCLNCGTELTGMYCHKCGQQARFPLPKMWTFIEEYISDVFSLERQTAPTLINLIFHPGRLIKEYCAGRFTSYLHPMKLHFFLIVVIVTIFSFAGTDSKIKGILEEATNVNAFTTDISLSTITNDTLYVKKMDVSPRDTVKLLATYSAAVKYPSVVDIVQVHSIIDDDNADTLTAVVPHVLFEDKILEDLDENGYTQFSLENEYMSQEVMLNEIKEAWDMITSALLNNLPLIMLLTCPILSLVLRKTLWRRKHPRIYFYIFAMFYMVMVEILFILFYLGSFIFDYTFNTITSIILGIVSLYLLIALKQTFDISSWWKATIATAIINSLYIGICYLLIIIVSAIIFMSIVFQSHSLYDF